MYTLRLNGTVHTVTANEDGSSSYDPPIPESFQEKWDGNVRDMVKSCSGPSTRTTTDFHRGRKTLLDQMQGDEAWTKHLVQEARKQGYSPGANDVYLGQMADKTGDPKAFFKPDEGLSELKKRALACGKGVEMPGLTVEPAVKEAQPKAISEKHIKNFAKQYKASGEASGMTDGELRTHIVETHGRKN